MTKFNDPKNLNGNIANLKRSASKGQNTMASAIDNLTYVYANNNTSNRLVSVTDSSVDYRGYPDTSETAIEYDDPSGNMKSHKDKGILGIKYNHLSLPHHITFDKTYIPRFSGLGMEYNVNTQYLYRADGMKLRKIYTYGSGRANTEVNTITEYLDGFQYEAEDTGVLMTGMPLKFVPTSEGYYDFEKNRYIYSYMDHLGNIRVSYFKNASGSAEVLEENNFYPFGLKHEGYNAQTGNPSYNYQYNGKELQKETGWSDYGARMYMSDIGRWGVIDPLADQYRRLTPYNYAANNPIRFIDPDGRKLMAVNGGSDPLPSAMAAGGMMDYYANGGSGSRSDLLKFLGQEDYMGVFFSAVDKRGGGGSATFGETQWYREIMAYLAQPESESGNYFQGIDFSKFGNIEPPIDLFGASAGQFSAFHQVPKNFKYVVGDGIFTVFAHANSSGIQYYDESGNKQFARTVSEFDDVMSSRSKEWKQARENGSNMTVIFFACNVGSGNYQEHDGRTTTVSTTFAEKLSKLPGMTVIAPDGYVGYGWRNNKPTLTNISNYRNDGGFLTFRGGEQILEKRSLSTILFISQINSILREKNKK